MAVAKVLVVDDEKDFLESISERLARRGFEVQTAENGIEALDKLEAGVYDAVLLDLMMPELDGLETLKRALKAKPDLQIILLTGQATVEKGVEAMKLGALDVVEKPADLDKLAGKIKESRSQRMLLVEKEREGAIEAILKRYSW